jgi:hypothetical protein
MIIQTYLTIPDDSFQKINFDKVKKVIIPLGFTCFYVVDNKALYKNSLHGKYTEILNVALDKSHGYYNDSMEVLIKILMRLTNKNFHEVLADIQE